MLIFEENEARKLIKQLLENDADYYKQYLGDIMKFNSEQIQNLLNGNQNFDYPISKDKIKDLIRKFDNFKILTHQWYKREDYYQYLIPIWKHYICTEALKRYNPNKRAKLLESRTIKYSDWPNEIKFEFNDLLDNMFISDIYNNKDKFNKRNDLDVLINKLENMKKKIILKKEEKEKKEKSEVNINSFFKLISYIGSLCTACQLIEGCNDYFNNDIASSYYIDDFYNWDNWDNYDYSDNIGDNANIENKSSKLEIVHAAFSVLNLIESIDNFFEIQKEIKNINDKNHKKNIDDIVSRFNDHISAINFGCNLEQLDDFIEKVNCAIKNIQSDQELLKDEFISIKEEIQSLQKQEEKAKIGLGKSIFYGISGIISGVMSGGITLITHIATGANALSGMLFGYSWYECHNCIENLEKLIKRIEAENEQFNNAINTLSENIKIKSISLPDYLESIKEPLNNINC